MVSNENHVWESGALVQIKKGVHGAGEVGIVIGPATHGHWGNSGGCLDALFGDVIWQVHPSNLQVPDGRTRRRG